MRVTLEIEAARALWCYAYSVGLVAGRHIKYEVPMAVLGESFSEFSLVSSSYWTLVCGGNSCRLKREQKQ